MITLAQGLLACPVCLRRGQAGPAGGPGRGTPVAQPLEIGPAQATCANGHAFDIARQGYLNLLGGAQPCHADTAAMVAARNRVHQAGLFALVAESLRDLTHSNPAQAGGTVMEVGAGPAYYLASLVESTQATGLALDISTAAARAAAQASRRIAAVVADVWQPLPLLDGVIDLILCVFAPRNLPEFARVLHPAGQVVVVTPNSGHLARLRQQYGLIGIGQAKTTDLQRGPFRLIAAQQLCYPVELPAPLATDVIGMGPNAFHHPPPVTEGLTDHVDLTIHMLDLPEGTS